MGLGSCSVLSEAENQYSSLSFLPPPLRAPQCRLARPGSTVPAAQGHVPQLSAGGADGWDSRERTRKAPALSWAVPWSLRQLSEPALTPHFGIWRS